MIRQSLLMDLGRNTGAELFDLIDFQEHGGDPSHPFYVPLPQNPPVVLSSTHTITEIGVL